MTISYAPFDAGAGANVTEATWRSMARHWVQTGVLDGERSEFAVSESTPAAMSVAVAPGTGFVRGHWVDSDATETKPIGTADASNPRIDRVVLRADFTANAITIEVLEGTPAASPTAPALTQSTSRWEISLAQVAVAAGATSIVNANITDERTIVPSNAAYGTAAVKTEVDTEESTTSTVYDGLASTHEVTVTTGHTGKLLLHYTVATRGSASGVIGYSTPLIIRTSDSATVVAADDARAIYLEGTLAQRQGGTFLFEGAANTQYRVVMRHRTSSGTAYFGHRILVVERAT